MKNKIISLGEKNRKVFGFTDAQIIISSKGHKTFESLIDSTHKSGIMESVKTIPIVTLKELVFNEKDETFTIKYEEKGKIKKDSVQLDDLALRDSIVSEIAELKNFNKTIVDESKTKPLLLNFVAVLAIPVFTWVLRGMALEAEHGEHYVASGRRSGAKQLLGNIVEAIGSTGITIIGILGIIYMIYITYKRFNNPASEVKFC